MLGIGNLALYVLKGGFVFLADGIQLLHKIVQNGIRQAVQIFHQGQDPLAVQQVTHFFIGQAFNHAFGALVEGGTVVLDLLFQGLFLDEQRVHIFQDAQGSWLYLPRLDGLF